MKNPFKSNNQNFSSPPGQSKGILDDFAVRKVVSTREGTIEKVPVNNSDITNKKYVDDSIAAIPTPPAANLQNVTTAGNTTTKTMSGAGLIAVGTISGANIIATGVIGIGTKDLGDLYVTKSGNVIIEAKSTGTTGFASNRVDNDWAGASPHFFNFIIFDSAYAGDWYGLPLANLAVMHSYGSDLVMGTYTANNVYLAANSTIAMQIDTNGYIHCPTMPTSDPADGTNTLWYDPSTRIVYMGT